MSTIVLASKIFGGVAAATTVSAGGYFLTTNLLTRPESLNNFQIPTIFVVAENITPETLNGQNKIDDYKCQIVGETQQTSIDLSCKISVLKLESDSKKHIKYSDLNSKTWETPTLDVLSKSNNVFKVEVKQDLYSKLIGDNPKNLEVVSNKSGNKKLANLKTLFGINGSTLNAKAQYAIAKIKGFSSSSNSAASISAQTITIKTADNKCLFAGEANKESGVNCSIYQFSTSPSSGNLDSLTFATNTNKEESITIGSYYLFKYDDASSAKSPSDFNSDSSVKVSLKEGVTQNDATQVDTITLSDLLPATVVDNDGNSIIFSFSPKTSGS